VIEPVSGKPAQLAIHTVRTPRSLP
jgi:hypothetical protein